MKYDYQIYLLLKATQNNSDINLLRREGIEFSEISKLIKFCLEEGYIIFEENEIKTTKSGEDYYRQLADVYKNSFKIDWIEKENESKATKVDINFVYLPDKNSLNF